MNTELYHYGTPHFMSTPHSGRYPWGSGEEPEQHAYAAQRTFLDKYRKLKSEGMKEKDIAAEFGITVDELRKKNSIAAAAERAANITRAQRLADKGLSNVKIAEIMGTSESTVRGWRKVREEKRSDKINAVADVLEKRVKKGQMVDVGLGSNNDLNVTKTTFDTALKILKDKGYVVDTIDIPQPNSPGKFTTIKVLAPAGTTKKDLWLNRGDIKTITEYFPKDVDVAKLIEYPASISLDRIFINYTNPDGKTGGVEKDGLIEIRPGVKDLSLGNSNYAQVRIAVDDKYYMKGMAIYSNDIPKGYDVILNTKYTKDTPIDAGKIIKKLKDDPEMPFGATIKAGGQYHYIDIDGTEKLGAINKLKEEGEWGAGNKALSSQFLSKQPLQMINRQLDLTYKNKADEFQEIMDLTNPVVKKKLLLDFAEGCDKDAYHLHAAALPRQNTRVLIPVPELKDNECYAPTYANGEKLALVRYPHGGTFEIPVVTVNNRNPAAKKLLGNAADAIGINKATAGILSGADFDGDFVLTIPTDNGKTKVKASKPLAGLVGFDPCESYPGYEGMHVMTSRETQLEMGKVSNLISDMTLRNATPDELTRAVRHSMVVIDAEKHHLNYRQSEKDNAIDALKQKYQKNPDSKKGYGGASTLISRAEAEVKVDEIERVDLNRVKTTPTGEVVKVNGKTRHVRAYTPDKETGEWHYEETGRTYSKVKKDSKGNIVLDDDGKPIYEKHKYKTETQQMNLVKDARQLSSGTAQEESYADYANKMKALANRSRKEAMAIEPYKASSSARETYKAEVDSLNAQLELAKSNKPRERAAQVRANLKIEKIKENNPEMKKDKLKKESAKALTTSRLEVGAGKKQIEISPKEWEAIQNRAISPTKLSEILNNTDMDKVRDLATPKNRTNLSSAKVARIKAMDGTGLSIADIAEQVGVSPSTVSKYLKE